MDRYEINAYLLKVEEIVKVGLKYSKDPYAVDNYEQLQSLTAKFIANLDEIEFDNRNYFTRDVYPTPSVSVRTIFLSEDKRKVFLVQEASDSGWSFPGGWTEIGLSPIESAKKEVWEEAGYDCEITRLVGVIDRYYKIKAYTGIPEYVLIYAGTFKGEPHPTTYEITNTGWFAIDKLPPISKKNNLEQMQAMLDQAVKDTTLIN